MTTTTAQWVRWQKFLTDQWGYTGPINGQPTRALYKPLQRFLAAKFRYTGAVSGLESKKMWDAFGRAKAAGYPEKALTPQVTPPVPASGRAANGVLNVRAAATTAAAILTTVPAGALVEVEAFTTTGEDVAGTTLWFERAAGGWIWAGGFDNKSTAGLTDKTPVVVIPPVVVPAPLPPVDPSSVLFDLHRDRYAGSTPSSFANAESSTPEEMWRDASGNLVIACRNVVVKGKSISGYPRWQAKTGLILANGQTRHIGVGMILDPARLRRWGADGDDAARIMFNETYGEPHGPTRLGGGQRISILNDVLTLKLGPHGIVWEYPVGEAERVDLRREVHLAPTDEGYTALELSVDGGPFQLVVPRTHFPTLVKDVNWKTPTTKLYDTVKVSFGPDNPFPQDRPYRVTFAGHRVGTTPEAADTRRD